MSSKMKFAALLIVVISLLINNVKSTRDINLSGEICGFYEPAVFCKRKEDCFEKCGGRPSNKVFCVRTGHGFDRVCCCRA